MSRRLVSRAHGVRSWLSAKNSSKNKKVWFANNASGLNNDKMLEATASLRVRNAYAGMFSETWRGGCSLEVLEIIHGFHYIGYGCEIAGAFGSKRGVGFLLSPAAFNDWVRSGRKVLFASDRNLALRFDNSTSFSERQILAVASYYPHSGRSDLEVKAHEVELDLIMNAKNRSEDILIGGDVNADIGRQCNRSDENPRAKAVGPNGLRYWNERGDRLVDWALSNQLMFPRSFFQKDPMKIATYFDIGSHLPHANDQFIVSKSLFPLVHDSGRASPLVNSDHLPIYMTTSNSNSIPKQSRQNPSLQSVRRDFGSLMGTSNEVMMRRSEFNSSMVKNYAMVLKSMLDEISSSSSSSSATSVTYSSSLDPSLSSFPSSSAPSSSSSSSSSFISCTETVLEEETTLHIKTPPGPLVLRSSYNVFTKALEATVVECVPKVEKPRPGWFISAAPLILEAAQKRAQAESLVASLGKNDPRLPTALELRRVARRCIVAIVAAAKDKWIRERCDMLNGDSDSCSGHQNYWKAAKDLIQGLQKPTPSKKLSFRDANGKLASSDEENLAVFVPYCHRLYNRPSSFDPSVIEELEQKPLIFELSDPPSASEIKECIHKLKKGKSGGFGQPAEAFMILIDNAETFLLIEDFIRDFWDSELAPDNWVTLKLAILPKKGDLHDPKNTRGIALMEAVPKLLGRIITDRINKHIVLKDPSWFSYQSGFVPGRGCPDASMLVRLGLLKRHQCDLDSFVLFIDLVKAFDSIDRIALDGVLGKFGVPPKLRNVIMALHSNVKISVSMGDKTALIENTIGVVQGGTLSPVLFNIFVHAFVLSLNTSPWNVPKYKCKQDGILKLRSQLEKGGEFFELPYSFYADDSAFIFESRTDIETGSKIIRTHFERWGLEQHVGKDNSTSKTVALYCPGYRRSLSDGDTSRIVFNDGAFIHFVKEFSYLGSIIHYTLSDDHDIEKRIAQASSLFASLHLCIFSKTRVSFEAKRAAYAALILPVLLYGCECWAISSKMLHSLQSFHFRCVRAMTRTNLWNAQHQHVKSITLLQRLKLRSIDFYILRRSLRWLGHVARMSFDRTPRKMLSAWVPKPRFRGQKTLYYGSFANKCLERANIDTTTWIQLAQDRSAWRDAINAIKI